MRKFSQTLIIILIICIFPSLFPCNCNAQRYQTNQPFSSSFFDFSRFYGPAFSTSFSSYYNTNPFSSGGFIGGTSFYQNPYSFSNIFGFTGPFSSSGISPFTSSGFGYSYPYYNPFNPVQFPSRIGTSNFLSVFGGGSGGVGVGVGVGVNSSQDVSKKPNLVYLVETDKPIYEPGETVEITFTVDNKGNADAVIDFPSGKKFDVLIKNKDGESIWQHSLHMSYIQTETTLTIGAGKDESFKIEWNQENDDGDPVPQGSYSITAFLTPKNNKYKGSATTHIGIRTLPTFTDCEELKEKLEELIKKKTTPYYPTPQPRLPQPWIPTPSPFLPGVFDIGFRGISTPSLGQTNLGFQASGTYPNFFSAVPYSSPAPKAGDTGGSEPEYSTTNIQVAGVDESDIIKNDGSTIYVIRDKKVELVKAVPADALEEWSEISFDNEVTPTQLYVDGDILVVIGTETRFKPFYHPDGIGFSPMPFYYPRASYTIAYIYDVSDRENPDLDRTVKIEARYLQSRKVDDILYIIMNADPPYDLVDQDVVDARTLIPIFHDSKNHSNDEGEPFVDCHEIAFFPGYTQPNYLLVIAIPVDNPEGEIKRELILGKSENIYCSRENLYVTSTSFITEDFPPASPENPGILIRPIFRNSQKTMVYKFSLNNGSVKFTEKGMMPGTVLNQFSMDEYNGYFSIATTTNSPNSNNLFILDDSMKLVGSLEDIAVGEQIKSVRYIGDKVYIVTFRVIDPFFVITRADPTNPEILGELKISGYSDYLHPYDETHIVGFGKEVVNNRAQGLKISLFDVSDVTNPIELHKEVIGYIGTDSLLLRDQKALLFSTPKNLMAFPISVTQLTSGSVYNYKHVFDGAYFYYIDATDFYKQAQISHNDALRIIYIGSYYYTVSDKMVTSIEMNTFNQVDILNLQ